MQSIDIDFDVFKALTNRRTTEEETYNDVLRKLLNLGTQSPAEKSLLTHSNGGWVTKGIYFPNGTEFKSTYKGRNYTAQIKEGAFYYNDKKYGSPSAAAIAITDNSVNGWIFWECRFPGQSQWRSLKSVKESLR